MRLALNTQKIDQPDELAARARHWDLFAKNLLHRTKKKNRSRAFHEPILGHESVSLFIWIHADRSRGNPSDYMAKKEKRTVKRLRSTRIIP